MTAESWHISHSLTPPAGRNDDRCLEHKDVRRAVEPVINLDCTGVWLLASVILEDIFSQAYCRHTNKERSGILLVFPPRIQSTDKRKCVEI